ncbi:MAG: sigma-54 dependent transcriptional regulator [Spirochaetales bacterium]|nr:sigma-54 dependent transcriptional regulator [Spirochaetales bacterium]
MAGLQNKNILVVDDEEGIRFSLKKVFQKHAAEVHTAADSAEALQAFSRISFDIAVVDLKLKGDENGISLMQKIKELDADIPVIMITGYGTVENAVTAMKKGAADFILKPVDNQNLLDVVERNIQITTLKAENAYLRNEIRENLHQTEYITENNEIRHALALADKTKNTNASILITGESGTGKEVLAQYIHYTSDFCSGPFVSLNCAALDDNLLLSELFGYEKGAFTGAHKKKLGKFELAHGGTLFLDEIGDMSLQIQSKILRALEERAFERVGGNRKIHADFRLITATNKDISQMISDGSFRRDLYYRIHVLELFLKPLRERPEDIEPLAQHFLRVFSRKYNTLITDGIKPEILARLKAYWWPGNIRELRNCINQAVLLSERGQLILRGFSEETKEQKPENAWYTHSLEEGESLLDTLKKISDTYEKSILKDYIERFDGNKSEIARQLKITRKTLMRKLNEHGL